MGYPPAEARGAVRLSNGRTTSDAEIDATAAALPAIIDRLRDGRVYLDRVDGTGETAK